MAAGEAEGRGWHVASVRPPRLAASFGHLESLDLTGRQHPVCCGADLSNHSRKKIPAKVVGLSPRGAPDPIWAKCNSLDLEGQATRFRPASLPLPAPPPTLSPDRGIPEARARGGPEQVRVHLERPHHSPISF